MTAKTPTPAPVPETHASEIEVRRQVLQATEELSDLIDAVGLRARELHALGVPADEWLDLIVRHLPPFARKIYGNSGGLVSGMIDGYLDARAANALTGDEGIAAAMAGKLNREIRGVSLGGMPVKGDLDAPIGPEGTDYQYSYETLRMRKVITRLFAEAPKLTTPDGKPDPSQSPALECTVVLKGGFQLIGALSLTPEGTLRMLCPNEMGRPVRPVMVEHFFDYEQVADIALIREVKASGGSGIITS